MRTGRPTKQKSEFLKAAKEVISDKSVIYLTDDDLLALINDKLPQDKQISQRTFRRWKAKSSKDDASDKDNFCCLLRKAKREQELFLLKRILNSGNQWRRWAWILERKFDEWNLRKLTTDPELRKRVYWWKNY